MSLRASRVRLLIASLSLFTPGLSALARPMHMMESHPAAGAVVDGRNAQYFVRFDAPVDHRNSRLFITNAGRLVQTLPPLLSAAPEVLFASADALAPGDYELHWAAKSMPDADFTDGSVALTVVR